MDASKIQRSSQVTQVTTQEAEELLLQEEPWGGLVVITARIISSQNEEEEIISLKIIFIDFSFDDRKVDEFKACHDLASLAKTMVQIGRDTVFPLCYGPDTRQIFLNLNAN
ncbi:hypothetical protein ACJX0J_028828, partial [Zea mays]